MRRVISCIAIAAVTGVIGCGNDDDGVGPTNAQQMNFFVTSATSTTGNLGGLRGADSLCQGLAATVAPGRRIWRAYMSVERDPDNNNGPTHARNRIGTGPWFNANGIMVASGLADLHARKGDAEVFVDERGQRIAGQWPGSPRPVEHDILTGSTADGMLLPGMTCADWTSDSASVQAQVGHSDGLGPNGDTSGTLASWNSSHANQNCANTAPRGGAGRIYCFARN
jgi:hypothetical protein